MRLRIDRLLRVLMNLTIEIHTNIGQGIEWNNFDDLSLLIKIRYRSACT